MNHKYENSQKKLTILLMTYNEEKNLPYFFNNINNFCNEVIVLDSGSTDNTIDILKQHNAQVYFREFDNFSSQRNVLLNIDTISSEWILVLDADEYLTIELKKEINELLGNQKDCKDAYYINRRFYWNGSWLKRSFYPQYLLRLGKNGFIKCDNRPINEHLICTTKSVGYLKNDFVDDNHNGLSAWIIKHNNYSSREAELLLIKDDTKYSFFKSQYERKRWIRQNIWNNTPPIIRPILYFIYKYFICFGFLDGWNGFTYHYLDSFYYRALIDFKYIELKKMQDY